MPALPLALACVDSGATVIDTRQLPSCEEAGETTRCDPGGRQSGSVIREPAYAFESSLVLRGADDYFANWSVAVSRYPRKLWIRQSVDYGVATAVFSALP